MQSFNTRSQVHAGKYSITQTRLPPRQIRPRGLFAQALARVGRPRDHHLPTWRRSGLHIQTCPAGLGQAFEALGALRSAWRGIAFPREAWARLILERDPVRETIMFWPSGEMPRTPASLLERFYKLPKGEMGTVGIGGVDGALFYAPDLDLIGLPRVDFTVHCPDGVPDLGFVRRLDPALAPVEDPMGACSLVIHLLRRPQNYFHDRFADPAECLLDLQEMRLENQARQFLRSFAATKGEDF